MDIKRVPVKYDTERFASHEAQLNGSGPAPSSSPETPPSPFGHSTAPDGPTKKARRRKLPAVLASLLVLALLGAGVLGYLWYNSQRSVNDLQQENEQLRTERDKLTQDIAGMNTSAQVEQKRPRTASDLTAVLLALQEQGRQASAEEVTAIEAALAETFEMPAAPEGVTVLAIYRPQKDADTLPLTNEHAAVLWPAVGDEPARIVELEKAVDSNDWRYLEAL